MRTKLFWTGWTVLFLLPAIYGIETLIIQDVPPIQPWKWAILLATLALIYFSRNTDDVLKHHVV